jgi:hypothetical protein
MGSEKDEMAESDSSELVWVREPVVVLEVVSVRQELHVGD